MELQLKNIGMIKEASVKIDGLTVIAGENDTGKSTIGKALYTIVKGIKIFDTEFKYVTAQNLGTSFLAIYLLLFKKIKLDNNTSIILKDKEDELIEFKGKDYVDNLEYTNGVSIKKNSIIEDIIFIESPLIWNLTDFFRDIAQIESQMNIKLDYPYLMKDLNFKLHIKSASTGLDIKKQMTDLMGGEFKKDEMGRYYFDKNDQRIELVNTATGIKTFGIFQVLSQNNYLNKNTILVLDEPEVHLHPKWQLEMAKIIVELVKNGVKVVVNSHSPYMIEALKVYSDKEKIQNKTNFYLTEKNEDTISSSIKDVTTDLEPIFIKLAEPYQKLELELE